MTAEARNDTGSRSTSSSRYSSLYRRVSFYEALETRFNSYVYHPNLFDCDGVFEIIPEQRREKTQSASDSSYQNNLWSAYRINASFLKQKPYHLSLFANRRRGVRKSDIFERQDISYANYGASLNYRWKPVPMYTSYRHDEQEIESSLRPIQNYIDDTFSYHADSDSKLLGDAYLDYELHQFTFDESHVTINKGTTHTLFSSSHRKFGRSKNKTLSSLFRYYALTDDRRLDELNWNERFSIKHPNHLLSYYEYGFKGLETGENDLGENHILAGLSHRLYESLTSSLELKGTSSDSDQFDEKIGQVSADEDYRKKIGISVLEVGVGATYEDRKRVTHKGILNVAREPHVVNDDAIVFLNETGVDPASILLSDKNGAVLFEGRDYQIKNSSGKIEIKRLPGSRISNREEVLADYVVKNPLLDYSLLQKRLRTSLGFWDRRLRFYYDQSNQDFLDVQEGKSFIPNTFDDSLYGVELRFKWTTSRGEYENYESTLSPFHALRFSENVSWDLTKKSHLGAGGSYDITDYGLDRRRTYSVSVTYLWNLSAASSFNFESGYRWQDDINTDLNEFVIRTTFKMQIHKLEGEVIYEFERGGFNETLFNNHYGIIKLKRRF